MPIRVQYPSHMSNLVQSETSIWVMWPFSFWDKSQKYKMKFSYNCHIFILGVKINVLDPRPVSVGQNRSRAIFPDVWLGHWGHYWCHKPSFDMSHQFVQILQYILQILQYYIVVIVLIDSPVRISRVDLFNCTVLWTGLQ